MSLHRITLSPSQLRQHIYALPVVNLDGLLKMSESAGVAPPRGRHLDQKQALSMTIELLGLGRVHELVKLHPQIPTIWMALYEDYGWGPASLTPESEPKDLQATLLASALKTIARSRGTSKLDIQEILDRLMGQLDVPDEMRMKLIQHLILDEKFTIPWSCWVS